jgi:hypothetical protein
MSDALLIKISADQIRSLDLAALTGMAAADPSGLLQLEDRLELQLDWPRAADDPRELSEVSECRLWSLRADARYPWLPLVLQRSSGQLARHVAMVVPHRFSRSEGLRFDDDALSLWISHRLFVLDDWGQQHQLPMRGRLAQMAAVLGFSVEPGFWPDA